LILSEWKRFEEALTCFDKAIEFNLGDHKAWYNRGVTLGHLGRESEELASLDTALSIQPD
jgi:tetratricopeptide (TPR) repeat protein